MSSLQKSHIIPAFVVRHLKATSATGFLRQAGSGDRTQDAPASPLLCSACEQRFCRWERKFSINAFPLIQSDDCSSFEYDVQLMKFAVSVSWRVLAVERRELLASCPAWVGQIDLTLENWRRYLLGKTNNPASAHHLFVVPGVHLKIPPGTHPKMLHYLLRSVDATVLSGARNLAVYVRLLRSIFYAPIVYAPIVPANPAGWKETRIHNGPGRLISGRQRISMRGFGNFLMSRVELGFANPLSAKAEEQIMRAAGKNPERLLSSETIQVHHASKHLRGIDGE